MSLYCIGDLQGCSAPFHALLEKIDFSPSRDTLYLLGDLVNRGPDSLGTLRSLAVLGDAAQCLLGNHDLHLLAVWQGVRQPGRHDTLNELLQAPDRDELLNWLRHRTMAIYRHGWLMVHAGVLPQWSTADTLALAGEVESALRGAGLKEFLQSMFGNGPSRWDAALAGPDRLRVIVNALTRLRFCTAQGAMEFGTHEGAGRAPEGFVPWFDVPGRATQHVPIAFGHWSTLVTDIHYPKGLRNNALPLDTGCIWGGCLTAARLDSVAGRFELVQVPCAQSLKPGK